MLLYCVQLGDRYTFYLLVSLNEEKVSHILDCEGIIKFAGIL
jgi:hypothetical protein